MLTEKIVPYPTPFLSNVDYGVFEEDILSRLVSVEYEAQKCLSEFVHVLENLLIKNHMAQTPELIVAHIAGYIGLFSACSVQKDIDRVKTEIPLLLATHSKFSYDKFMEYSVNELPIPSPELSEALKNLQESSPGSIADQTIRSSRQIYDMFKRLAGAYKRNRKTRSAQKEAFCPPENFWGDAIVGLYNDQLEQWKEILGPYPIDYAINQLTIQLAWIIGYFSHLDKKEVKEGEYLKYANGTLPLFVNYTQKLMKGMKDE